MSITSNRIRVCALAAALFPAAGLWAQERPNGFFLLTPASISSGYDDRFVVGSQSLSDSVTLLTTPTMAWMHSTHRSMFSVDYQGEGEIFSQQTGLDAWNHLADLHFTNQFSARWSIDIGDSFLSTMDPTRKIENSLLLLPRGRFNDNSFYTRLVYRLTHKTKLSARFDNSYTTMDLPADLAGRLDRAAFAGTLTVDHDLNQRHSLEANYSYLYVHSLQSGPDGIDNSIHNANLGYIFTANPGLTVRLFGGVSHGTAAGTGTSFTGAAAVDKKLGDLWVSAGYQRYVAFFGGFVPSLTQTIGPQPTGGLPLTQAAAPNSVYNVIALRAWGNLTKRIALQGVAQRALNGTTLDNRGIKSVIVQTKVTYKLRDRVNLFAEGDFFGQNISEFIPFAMSRRRYFGGVEFVLSRAPELTSNPNRRRSGTPDSDTDDIGKTEGHQ